ncbi:hypothetical protein [Sediminibacillus albus]|uniref:WYL domain-containing protein n=1 Tax=Sediminibacillus albus TaxID=407036 RepID=A0A1G8X4A4_9BACI|nr:hypothetical protein [Sediminibacillus albus]SDJ85146.1 hypothetical protein SAMN05216243_1140 [Sediminibacillus albus]
MVGLLYRSLESEKAVEMIYLASGGSISQRAIKVLAIYEDRIVAYCFTRKEIRTFKTGNILSLAPVKNTKKQEA